jgi:hypothetical protein
VKKGNILLLALILVGACALIWTSNALYSAKLDMAPYEAQAPVEFYAGFDKLMSNVSWMTLVQWEAEGNLDKPRCEALYGKLNSLTNLDPLFADAYLDGSLSLAPLRPDLSMQLLQKGIKLGLAGNWKVQFYEGLVDLQDLNRPSDAADAFKLATQCDDCPEYVSSMWMHARTMDQEHSDPIGAMNTWVDYMNGLSPQEQMLKQHAAGEVLELGQQIESDCDHQLQSTTDPAARKDLLARKALAEQIMASITPQPTTAPSETPAGLPT